MRVPDIVFHPCREPSPERPPKPATSTTVYRTGIRISLTPPPLRRHRHPEPPPPPRRTRSADSRRHCADSASGSAAGYASWSTSGGGSWDSPGSGGSGFSFRSNSWDSCSGSPSGSSGGDFGSGGNLRSGSKSDVPGRDRPLTPPRPGYVRQGTVDLDLDDNVENSWRGSRTSESSPKQEGSPRAAASNGRSNGPHRRPSRPPPPPPPPGRCCSVDVEDHHEDVPPTPRCRPRSWAGVEINSDLLERPRLLIGLASEEDVRLAEKKKEEGNLSYTAKKYQQALDLYSQAIDLCPQCAAYHNNRSACLLMLGQYRQALHEAREAVRLDSKYVKGLLRVAKCQVILGDVAGADSALKQAAALDPQNAGLATERRNMDAVARLTQELDLSWQKADYRRALFCAERALTVATGSSQLRVRRAECLVLLGRYPEAQDIVHDMLRADSMNADALYVRGMCLYYQDDVDKAFNHFQQVLRLAPDHQRARQVYKQAKQLKAKKEEGNLAFKKGQLPEALKLYSEALEIDPLNKATNAKLYFNRATVQARQNNTQEAIADCSQAIELDNGYVKAYLRRAKCYMLSEQYEEAVRDYEKVNTLDRSHEHRRLLHEAKHELKKSKRKDYYKILNLGRSATTDDIKKAYRKQALVHHPDRHSNATEEHRREAERRFKDVGEAYSVLSDRAKRLRYDNGQDLEDGDGYSGADVDHGNLFQAFFGGGGGPAPGGFRYSNMGGGQPFDFGGGAHAGGFQFQFG